MEEKAQLNSGSEPVPMNLLQVEYIQEGNNIYKVLVPANSTYSDDAALPVNPIICQVEDAQDFAQRINKTRTSYTKFSDLSAKYKTVKTLVKLPQVSSVDMDTTALPPSATKAIGSPHQSITSLEKQLKNLDTACIKKLSDDISKTKACSPETSDLEKHGSISDVTITAEQIKSTSYLDSSPSTNGRGSSAVRNEDVNPDNLPFPSSADSCTNAPSVSISPRDSYITPPRGGASVHSSNALEPAIPVIVNVTKNATYVQTAETITTVGGNVSGTVLKPAPAITLHKAAALNETNISSTRNIIPSSPSGQTTVTVSATCLIKGGTTSVSSPGNLQRVIRVAPNNVKNSSRQESVNVSRVQNSNVHSLVSSTECIRTQNPAIMTANQTNLLIHKVNYTAAPNIVSQCRQDEKLPSWHPPPVINPFSPVKVVKLTPKDLTNTKQRDMISLPHGYTYSIPPGYSSARGENKSSSNWPHVINVTNRPYKETTAPITAARQPNQAPLTRIVRVIPPPVTANVNKVNASTSETSFMPHRPFVSVSTTAPSLGSAIQLQKSESDVGRAVMWTPRPSEGPQQLGTQAPVAQIVRPVSSAVNSGTGNSAFETMSTVVPRMPLNSTQESMAFLKVPVKVNSLPTMTDNPFAAYRPIAGTGGTLIQTGPYIKDALPVKKVPEELSTSNAKSTPQDLPRHDPLHSGLTAPLAAEPKGSSTTTEPPGPVKLYYGLPPGSVVILPDGKKLIIPSEMNAPASKTNSAQGTEPVSTAISADARSSIQTTAPSVLAGQTATVNSGAAPSVCSPRVFFKPAVTPHREAATVVKVTVAQTTTTNSSTFSCSTFSSANSVTSVNSIRHSLPVGHQITTSVGPRQVNPELTNYEHLRSLLRRENERVGVFPTPTAVRSQVTVPRPPMPLLRVPCSNLVSNSHCEQRQLPGNLCLTPQAQSGIQSTNQCKFLLHSQDGPLYVIPDNPVLMEQATLALKHRGSATRSVDNVSKATNSSCTQVGVNRLANVTSIIGSGVQNNNNSAFPCSISQNPCIFLAARNVEKENPCSLPKVGQAAMVGVPKTHLTPKNTPSSPFGVQIPGKVVDNVQSTKLDFKSFAKSLRVRVPQNCAPKTPSESFDNQRTTVKPLGTPLDNLKTAVKPLSMSLGDQKTPVEPPQNMVTVGSLDSHEDTDSPLSDEAFRRLMEPEILLMEVEEEFNKTLQNIQGSPPQNNVEAYFNRFNKHFETEHCITQSTKPRVRIKSGNIPNTAYSPKRGNSAMLQPVLASKPFGNAVSIIKPPQLFPNAGISSGLFRDKFLYKENTVSQQRPLTNKPVVLVGKMQPQQNQWIGLQTNTDSVYRYGVNQPVHLPKQSNTVSLDPRRGPSLKCKVPSPYLSNLTGVHAFEMHRKKDGNIANPYSVKWDYGKDSLQRHKLNHTSSLVKEKGSFIQHHEHSYNKIQPTYLKRKDAPLESRGPIVSFRNKMDKISQSPKWKAGIREAFGRIKTPPLSCSSNLKIEPTHSPVKVFSTIPDLNPYVSLPKLKEEDLLPFNTSGSGKARLQVAKTQSKLKRKADNSIQPEGLLQPCIVLLDRLNDIYLENETVDLDSIYIEDLIQPSDTPNVRLQQFEHDMKETSVLFRLESSDVSSVKVEADLCDQQASLAKKPKSQTDEPSSDLETYKNTGYIDDQLGNLERLLEAKRAALQVVREKLKKP